MTKMLNSENLLSGSGIEPQNTTLTADRILYNYAIELCQSAALDELFGNPDECFQVRQNFQQDFNTKNMFGNSLFVRHPFLSMFVVCCFNMFETISCLTDIFLKDRLVTS